MIKPEVKRYRKIRELSERDLNADEALWLYFHGTETAWGSYDFSWKAMDMTVWFRHPFIGKRAT